MLSEEEARNFLCQPLTGPAHTLGRCPYCPEQGLFAADLLHFQQLQELAPLDWGELLTTCGWRRWAAVFYRPRCPQCSDCQALRVDVAHFRPRRDQRRCAQRNADLSIHPVDPGYDQERAALFLAYQRSVHADTSEGDQVLRDPRPLPGGELHARDPAGRLLAVSIYDQLRSGLSSVYCYYDPTLPRRSLGTFMVLAEIAHAASLGLPWLYLGYSIAGCGKMRYKKRFCPHQCLSQGLWRSLEEV